MSTCCSLKGLRSRSLIAPFDLHRPTTLEEAAGLRKSLGAGSIFMAGGVDVANSLKWPGCEVLNVIYLNRIERLKDIRLQGDILEIGSGVTHEAAARHPLVDKHLPTAARLWRSIANPRVRGKGTLGGNLMADNPAYELPALLEVLGTRILCLGLDGAQRIESVTAAVRQPDLVVSALIDVKIPIEIRSDRGLRPAVEVIVGLPWRDELVQEVRIAVACAHARPVFASIGLAGPMSRGQLAAAAPRLAAEYVQALPPPLDDWQASSTYRRRMIAHQLQQLLSEEGAS